MNTASSLKNALLKRHLDDWLNLFGVKRGFNPTKFKNRNLVENSNFVGNSKKRGVKRKRGEKFEDHVLDILRKNYDVETICKGGGSLNFGNYIKTVSSMRKGTKIIYQGALINKRNKIRGIPDFLVRSDVIDEIFDDYKYPYKSKGSLFSTKWHYVVCDAKFSKLNLCSDGLKIRNNPYVKFYKVQLWIYTKILGLAQGFMPELGFIIGNGFSFTKKKCTKTSTQFLNRPGIIEFKEWDKFVNNDLKKAIEWKTELENGLSWELWPVPEKDELYADTINGNEKWKNTRTEISKKQNDIAQLYYCSEKERLHAREQGVNHISELKSISDLGIKVGTQKAKVLSTLIEVQKSKKPNIPQNLAAELPKSMVYIDFETVNQCNLKFSDDSVTSDNFIYLIGMYQDSEYSSFVMDKMNRNSEEKMVIKWLKSFDHDKVTLVHWGNAEKIWLNGIASKFVSVADQIKNLNLFDLNRFFINKRIVFPGMKNFSLKEVVQYSKVTTNYSDLVITNGEESIHEIEKIISETNGNISKHVDFQKLIDYNKVDCIVLKELIDKITK